MARAPWRSRPRSPSSGLKWGERDAPRVRLHELERILGGIPPHPAPKLELEQYATPADVAAPLLYEAWTLGDIEGRAVADLGCGTGIFALGAALLGAASVVGVDADEDALAVARRESARLKAPAEWVASDVGAWRGAADTVIMNPPFGAQQRGADRAFLDAAFRTAPTVYTMHNAGTRAFVEQHAAAAGYARTHAWGLRFALRHQYRHHEKAVREVDVVALRLVRTESRESRDG